jgi:hypothetical protein
MRFGSHLENKYLFGAENAPNKRCRGKYGAYTLLLETQLPNAL